ncbi:MAG: hypothetical protein ACK5MN_00510 [Lachnospiraceae bacterium]
MILEMIQLFLTVALILCIVGAVLIAYFATKEGESGKTESTDKTETIESEDAP